MKHITIDRIVVVLITIAIMAIYQRQSSTDKSQDNRTEQFFNELQSVRQKLDTSSILPVDSVDADTID